MTRAEFLGLVASGLGAWAILLAGGWLLLEAIRLAPTSLPIGG